MYFYMMIYYNAGEVKNMADYQEMYLTLFRAVTKAIELLDGNEAARARALLVRAQQEAEELYISGA